MNPCDFISLVMHISLSLYLNDIPTDTVKITLWSTITLGKYLAKRVEASITQEAEHMSTRIFMLAHVHQVKVVKPLECLIARGLELFGKFN